jgi:hypothetical protein
MKMTTQYEVHATPVAGGAVRVAAVDTPREAQEQFNDWAESLQHQTVRLFERGAAGEPVESVRWRISADVEAGIEAVNRQPRTARPVRKLTDAEESLMRDPRPHQRVRALAVLDALKSRGIDVETLRRAV